MATQAATIPPAGSTPSPLPTPAAGRENHTTPQSSIPPFIQQPIHRSSESSDISPFIPEPLPPAPSSAAASPFGLTRVAGLRSVEVANQIASLPADGWERLPTGGRSLAESDTAPRVEIGLPTSAQPSSLTSGTEVAAKAWNAIEPTAGFYETTVQDLVREPNQSVSPFLPASVAGVEAIESRRRLATQVSRELLADSLRPLADAPTAVEPPTGWKNIESELRQRLARSRELLRRQAILSAREEVLAGLRSLTRAIDLRTSSYSSEPALNRALTALDEELDFHQSLRHPSHSLGTPQIVARHETPALKNVPLEGVAPELAAQHYRTYAREQLQLAAQEHPWAADLFYALGQTYECQASDAQPDSRIYRHQAMTCYIAALDVSPEHAEGAQQLGYVLMLLDRLEEAENALRLAIAKKPTLTAWDHLAEVYRRRGDPQQASLAANQANALRTSSPGSTIPDVVSLDPRAFAGISPNQVLGSTSSREATTATPSAAVAKDTASRTNWLSRWWR